MRIAIIGAGLAGLTLARGLSASHSVTVFEKARGPGGRMSTRRATPYAFDHGAQYFTAESDPFLDLLSSLKSRGIIAEWPDRIDLRAGARVSDKPKLVASPGMNGLCKTVAEGLNVRPGVKIETLRRDGGGWSLVDAEGALTGPFDWVVSTAPAPQTDALLPASFAGKAKLSRVKMLGCFALMLGFETPLDLPWQALKSGAPPIGWMAVNSAKPDRVEAFSLLIQSSNDWADAHLEDDPETVKSVLLHAASDLTGIDLTVATHQVLHRWRYAATETPLGAPYLIDQDLNLAACGDWCLGSKVEAAFLSAEALAKAF
nr:NAD(P)-binding protein [Hyphomonas sp. Mor2]